MVYFTLWKIPRWEQNCQHAYDALQKPKHQPKSVWSDLHIVKKISEFKSFKEEWCIQLF